MNNIQKMKNVLEAQGQRGTWDYDPYMHGMYNGMKLMMALAEGRDPDYKEAPEEWLSKKEWQGLTDEDVVERSNKEVFAEAFARGVAWAELKLKEKNNG